MADRDDLATRIRARLDGYQHPCPTLTAIAEALGIKEES